MRDCGGKSSRPRYHVWLLWSRRPALEFFTTSRGRSRDSRYDRFALVFKPSATTKIVGQVLPHEAIFQVGGRRDTCENRNIDIPVYAPSGHVVRCFSAG